MSEPTTFHLKYRPKTLDKVLGHETAVNRLTGIIKSGKYPNALMLTGPSSAGKTTLARCFAAEVLEVEDVERHPDYLEQNAGSDGGVDDIRQIIEVARLNPLKGKKRFLVLDESHRLNGAAQDAILKPLEQPAKNTIFILCSMEPEKFSSGKGRAIANRCSPFVLEAPTESTLCRYISRIIKTEKLPIDDKDLIRKIAQASNSEFRTAAGHLEGISQTLGAKGKGYKVTEADILSILKASEAPEDEIAVRILIGVYTQKFSLVQKAILDAGDSYALINKLLWTNSYCLNKHVLKGERHPKVWGNKWGDKLIAMVSDYSESNKDSVVADSVKRMNVYAATQSALVSLRQQAASFLVPEQNLISAILYQLVRDLRSLK